MFLFRPKHTCLSFLKHTFIKQGPILVSGLDFQRFFTLASRRKTQPTDLDGFKAGMFITHLRSIYRESLLVWAKYLPWFLSSLFYISYCFYLQIRTFSLDFGRVVERNKQKQTEQRVFCMSVLQGSQRSLQELWKVSELRFVDEAHLSTDRENKAWRG